MFVSCAKNPRLEWLVLEPPETLKLAPGPVGAQYQMLLRAKGKPEATVAAVRQFCIHPYWIPKEEWSCTEWHRTGGEIMLDELLPRRLDNEYRGSRLALWLFGLVVAMKGIQSLAIIFNGYSTARDADGIPLDSYTPAVAQTVVAVFAQGSLWRLFFCLLCVLVLLRYRSGVPLMFALLALNYLTGQVVLTFVPLPRVGTPLGPLVNLMLFVVMLVGLGLSLRRRGGPVAQG